MGGILLGIYFGTLLKLWHLVEFTLVVEQTLYHDNIFTAKLLATRALVAKSKIVTVTALIAGCLSLLTCMALAARRCCHDRKMMSTTFLRISSACKLKCPICIKLCEIFRNIQDRESSAKLQNLWRCAHTGCP